MEEVSRRGDKKVIELSMIKRFLTYCFIGLISILFSSCISVDLYDFTHYDHQLPYQVVDNGSKRSVIESVDYDLPDTYLYNGEERYLEDFFKNTQTTAFLVMQNGRIIDERYFMGTDENTLFISNSIAKSITSTLIGFALQDGYIKSVDEPVTNYIPELMGSGFDSVTIENLLQMCSGIKYNEGFGRYSLFSMIDYIAAERGNSIDYLMQMENDFQPGTSFRYASVDSLVLGIVLERAAGVNPGLYLQDKLWTELGMQAKGYWNQDYYGNVLTFGYYFSTLRDYARFAQFILQRGNWQGEQLLSAGWIDSAVTAREGSGPACLLPGNRDDADNESWGYQYQWWQDETPQNGAFMAVGVYGQYIYIDPVKQLVMVRTALDTTISTSRYKEMVAVFESLAQQIP